MQVVVQVHLDHCTAQRDVMFFSRNKSNRRLQLAAMALATTGIWAGMSLSSAAVGIKEAAVARVTSKLENRFARPLLDDGRSVTGIIVLGGSRERAKAALELARRHPSAVVILSGPGSDEEAIFEGAPELAERVVIDRRARTTFENALFSAGLVAPAPDDRWLIVTSAVHMPRSMGAFRAVGFKVEPWPVADTPAPVAQAEPLVQHEVLGLIYYRLLRRTDALFPRAAL